MVHVTYSNLNFEQITYTYEIEINKVIQSGQITTIPMMAQAEFINIVRSIVYDQRPCRVRFTFADEIWSQIDQKWKRLDRYIEFANRAYDGVYDEN